MKWISIIILFLISITAFGQDKPEVNKKDQPKIGIEGQYRKIKLGMNRKQVQEVLSSDPDLEVDVETDYGDFDKQQKFLLKAKRKPFIHHIYYQFYHDEKQDTKKSDKSENKTDTKKKDSDDKSWKLYAIIIQFNNKYNDYPTLYERILSKYGEADIRTSRYAMWKASGRSTYKTSDGRNIGVLLILNHPSTIKIIDYSKYQAMVDKQRKSPQEAVKNYQREVNERLLEDFTPQSPKGDKKTDDKKSD